MSNYEIFLYLLKIIFDFTCVGFFIKYRKRAFVQVRHPTLVLLIISGSNLSSLIEAFIKLDSVHPKKYISCGAYAFNYSFVNSWVLLAYLIMICKIYIKSGIKETRIADKVKLIASVLSGQTNDEFNWDNPKLLRKLKRQKMLSWFLLFIVVPLLDFVLHTMIIKGNLHLFGVENCKPHFHLITYFLYSCVWLISLLAILNMKFQYDIFKVKFTLVCVFITYTLYGTIAFVDMLSSIVYGKYVLDWKIVSIYTSIISTSYTLYPIYLSSKKIPNKFNIESIWRDKDKRNKFKSACEATYCGNYVSFLLDYDQLDFSKPLLVQKMTRKYFDPESPLYLDLLLESLSSWFLDLHQPDSYTFKTIHKHVTIFLQKSVVCYMDPNFFKVDVEK